MQPQSFHASPAEAVQAPPEEFLYLACLHEGTGVEQPDFLAVVDAESGTIVHETPMPNVGDELHHFGWNRCSSACHGPDRSHLIVPGFRSSRIHVLNVADDPRRPRDREGDRARRADRQDRLHAPAHRPLHARRQRRDQHARRCRRQRRGRLRGARRRELRAQGPLGERRPAALAQLRLLVPAAPERARLVGVRRARGLRAGVRPRGRRRRALRQPAPLLEPRASAASSRRSTSARPGWCRWRCAGSTTPTPTRASWAPPSRARCGTSTGTEPATTPTGDRGRAASSRRAGRSRCPG